MKIFLTLALLLLTSSCRTDRYRYLFTPSPAEILVQPEGKGIVARALITVLEGVSGDESAMMHLRIRIENRDDEPVRLAADSLQLVGSDLAEFGQGRVDPPAADIPPGAIQTYDLRFAFPPGLKLSAPDLDGLNLAWRLEYAGGAAEVSTTFQRRVEDFYEPQSNVAWSVGVGYSG